VSKPLLQIYSHFNQDPTASARAISAYKKLATSQIFDANFYLKKYPDVCGSKFEPLLHYILYGARDQRVPHALFDPDFFQKPSSKRQSNPLLDYLDTGLSRLSNPHQLFDAQYYAEQFGGLNVNPLEHFLSVGWKQGISPCQLFDMNFYLEQNFDVKQAGINPLLHFVLAGAFEGRSPHPLFDSQYYLRQLNIESSPRLQLVGNESTITESMYDYFVAHSQPGNTTINALIHYLNHGIHEARDPHILFSTRFYLKNVPGVEDAGVSPLVQYISRGAKEGYQPHPLFDPHYYAAQVKSKIDGLPLTHFLRNHGMHSPSKFFDVNFYKSNYPDVSTTKLNPLIHYLEIGCTEGRIPMSGFDPNIYSVLYPDAVHSGFTAVEHYAIYGEKEKRVCNLFAALEKRGITDSFPDALVPSDGLSIRVEKEFPTVTIILHGPANEVQLLRSLHALSMQTSDYSFELIALTAADAAEQNLLNRFGIPCQTVSTVCPTALDLNTAARNAKGVFLLFLQKDMVLERLCFRELIDTFARHPSCGLISPGIYSSSGCSILNRAMLSSEHVLRVDHSKPLPCERGLHEIASTDICPRAALSIRSHLFRRLGGFKSRTGLALDEDLELALNIRDLGFKSCWQRAAFALTQSDFLGYPPLVQEVSTTIISNS
jgi:hypothetical protein